MRNSPLSKTPPINLPVIPGVTCPIDTNNISQQNQEENSEDEQSPYEMENEDDIFTMD
eukprot:TRINITY_DN7594_c0_g1_i4.p1 TRINITY_DN7594_c0_g1~~TRINITY_DN7594_c0_g1_i4.p1  ORF type:complete len:58 (-),score=11.81 TRINITY_DN7594_c0_g1_i4:257-430(-)